jgi:hypothetical protein
MTTTRMTTRLPTALADALAARAKANHRSVNSELIATLEAALSGTPARAQDPDCCPYCRRNNGERHMADCPTQRQGKSVLSSGCYFAPDGTFMNADGTRSIFDDVDK